MTFIGKLLRYATGRLKTLKRLKIGDTVYVLSLPNPVKQDDDFLYILDNTEDKASVLIGMTAVVTGKVIATDYDPYHNETTFTVFVEDKKGRATISGTTTYASGQSVIGICTFHKLRKLQTEYQEAGHVFIDPFNSARYLLIMSPYKESLCRLLRDTENEYHRTYHNVPCKDVKRFAKVIHHRIQTI